MEACALLLQRDPSYGSIIHRDMDSESLTSSADDYDTPPEDFPDLARRHKPGNGANVGEPRPGRAPSPRNVNARAPDPVRVEMADGVTLGECCKCCTSWDDWCLCFSCNIPASFSLPLHERQCLRNARAEGWRLMWSFLFPLAVCSMRLQLVWVFTQFICATFVFSLQMLNSTFQGFDATICTIVMGLSALWLLLSTADAVVCILVLCLHHHRHGYRSDISLSKYCIVITPIRILYSLACLLSIVTVSCLPFPPCHLPLALDPYGGSGPWSDFPRSKLNLVSSISAFVLILSVD